MIKSISKRWNDNDIKSVIDFLNKADKLKLIAVIAIQFIFGLMDLLGVAILGVLGALAVTGVESSQPGTRVQWLLEFLHIDNMNLQQQAAVLALLSASLLVLKTLFSIFFIRKTLKFLAYKATGLSRHIISRMLSRPINEIQRMSEQETVYGLTVGISAISIGVIGNAISLASDASLLLVMGVGLLAIDPVMTLVLIALFALIGFILFFILNIRAVRINREQSNLAIKNNEAIIEILSTYREAVVRNRRGFYLQRINLLKSQMAENTSELSFMPFISKYTIEIAVVIGAVLISAMQFGAHDAKHAVATLSIFLAASTRIAPAVLRVQQGAIAIKSSMAQSIPTLSLIRTFSDKREIQEDNSSPNFFHTEFCANIAVSEVSFRYDDADKIVLEDISLEIEEGDVVALVGPSGAGKTTLVDLILGVLSPTSGKISISNNEPLETFEFHKGAVAYVPQDSIIIKGTILENVALGFANPERYVNEAIKALEIAQLSEVVATSSKGIHTYLGDKGVRLSGGQRQRLGIARALFTNPKMLVLDEATSALDGDTEEKITSSIYALKGKISILLIAHRLSTVKLADKVIYLEDGKILAAGTFDEVRSLIPNFDRQANLMGL